jgi:hypothetical protein
MKNKFLNEESFFTKNDRTIQNYRVKSENNQINYGPMLKQQSDLYGFLH